MVKTVKLGKTLQQSDPELVIDQLMTRYFQRLEEAVAEAEPNLPFESIMVENGVKLPGQGRLVKMKDFLNAVKAILRTGYIEGLGLLFGCRLRLADYGLAGLATANCRTFGDAMQLELAHAPLITPAQEVVCESTIDAGRVIVTFHEFNGERWAEHYLIEQEIASLLRLIREVLPGVSVDKHCEVKIAYSRPHYWRLYQQLLRCPVRFQQKANQISFPESWMQRPLDNTDPELSRVLEQQCQLVIERLERRGDWVDRLRRLLLETHGKPPTLQQAADRFCVPVHTFRRRLYQAGTTYKQIVYSIRMELAADYLRDTSLPLQEIVFLLGYEHAANFFNAFKKYWCITPSQFRHNK